MTQQSFKQINEPLDDAELEFLDQFLLNRLDDDLETDGKDEGVFDISTLDGLLTAIVIGPATILPSQWLPSLWGDFPHTWATQEEFEKIFNLLVRHMNSIASVLMEQPEDFEPLFLTREVSGKTHLIVDEWCEGFWRGTELDKTGWLTGETEVTILLTPILAFTSAKNWRAHDFKPEEVERLQNTITPNVCALHAYWLSRRTPARASPVPRRRSDPKISRNAPCPCGSGKKYKQCCLH
ncbi:MAG: UPF0149 family protein [Pseudohongiellaceae bacterium]